MISELGMGSLLPHVAANGLEPRRERWAALEARRPPSLMHS